MELINATWIEMVKGSQLPLTNGARVQDQGEIFEVSFPSACTTFMTTTATTIIKKKKRSLNI